MAEKKQPEAVTEKRTVTYEVVRGLANFLFHTLLPVRFHHRERLQQDPPYVLIANHRHALDPVAMAMGVRHEQLVFLAKKELGSTPLIRNILCGCTASATERSGWAWMHLKHRLKPTADMGSPIRSSTSKARIRRTSRDSRS